MLIAPLRKHLRLRTFVFNVASRDLHDILHAKRSELASLPFSRIFVRQSPANELEVFSTRRVGKNSNPRCDAALNEVRRFERAHAPCVKRYYNHVCGRDRVADDKRPSRSSQEWASHGGNSNDGSRRQCAHQ